MKHGETKQKPPSLFGACVCLCVSVCVCVCAEYGGKETTQIKRYVSAANTTSTKKKQLKRGTTDAQQTKQNRTEQSKTKKMKNRKPER